METNAKVIIALNQEKKETIAGAKKSRQVKNCPNCGAPVLSEVCQYCGTSMQDIDSQNIAPEYPTTKYKNIGGFLKFVIPAGLMGLGLLGLGIIIAVLTSTSDVAMKTPLIAGFGISFIVMIIVTAIILIKNAVTLFSIKKSEIITGVVYGYVHDAFMINDLPVLMLKVLIKTDNGSKFALIPTGTTEKKYAINSEIKLKINGKYVLVDKN